jgi:hypothetical protein
MNPPAVGGVGALRPSCALTLGPPKTKSVSLFRLIAAHIAELTRPFDEAVLPVRAFLNGCSLVTERVNRLPG